MLARGFNGGTPAQCIDARKTPADTMHGKADACCHKALATPRYTPHERPEPRAKSSCAVEALLAMDHDDALVLEHLVGFHQHRCQMSGASIAVVDVNPNVSAMRHTLSI